MKPSISTTLNGIPYALIPYSPRNLQLEWGNGTKLKLSRSEARKLVRFWFLVEELERMPEVEGHHQRFTSINFAAFWGGTSYKVQWTGGTSDLVEVAAFLKKGLTLQVEE